MTWSDTDLVIRVLGLSTCRVLTGYFSRITAYLLYNTQIFVECTYYGSLLIIWFDNWPLNRIINPTWVSTLLNDWAYMHFAEVHGWGRSEPTRRFMGGFFLKKNPPVGNPTGGRVGTGEVIPIHTRKSTENRHKFRYFGEK